MRYLLSLITTRNLQQHKTSLSIELIAGLTTFLTLAYVVIVYPSILGAVGIDPKAAFTATCLVGAIGSILMGLWANYPIALAPSMSLAGYFAFGVIAKYGIAWPEALGAVLIAGILFFILAMTGVRQQIVNAIPDTIKIALAAGIGLFLAVIALKNMNLILLNNHITLAKHFEFSPPVILFISTVILISLLDYFGVIGAILIGMLLTTVVGLLLGYDHFHGIFALPPSIKSSWAILQMPDFLNIKIALSIFTFLFVAFFDNTGTLIAVLQAGNLLQEDKSLRIKEAFLADSTATIIGAFLGTSSVGSYIESAAGVRAGGRTGLTAIVVGILFLAALFFSPLAAMVPVFATSAALFYIAILMQSSLKIIRWREITESIPALITLLAIPFMFSIADGIGLGLMSYVLLNIFARRWYKMNAILLGLAVVFAIYLGWGIWQ